MLNRRLGIILALLAVLGLFSYGVLQLFQLRFATGDSYPAYSSLRGDPLGCRVYFESLAEMGGTPPRRFIQSIEKLPPGRGATLFVFGLPWSEMSAEEDEYKALETFVHGGGRLVITLYPELGKPLSFNAGTGTNRPVFKNPLLDEEARLPEVNLRAKWGFGYEYSSRHAREFHPPVRHRPARCRRSSAPVHHLAQRHRAHQPEPSVACSLRPRQRPSDG